MTNDTTADATRALKGMLGIGIHRQVDNATTAVIEKQKSNGSTGKNGSSGNSNGNTKSSSKNTKSKKVNNSNNPASRTHTPSKKTPSSHKKKKDGGSNSNRNSNDHVKNNNQKNKPQHQQNNNTGNNNSTKKGKKKKQTNDNYNNNNSNGNGSGSTRGQGKNSGNNKQRNSTTAKDENYAWSAFQSPPDASTLPLPAFGNSFSFVDEGDVTEKAKQQSSQLDISVQSSDPAASTSTQEQESSTLDNTPTPKPSQSKPIISTEKQTENEIKAMLNISNKSDNVTNEEKVIDPSDAHPTDTTSASTNVTPMKEQRNPSGVNLAKLTISSSSNTTRTGSSSNSKSQSSTKQLQSPTNNMNNNSLNTPNNTPASKDPIAMLLNAQSYGTANPSFNNHPYHYNNNMYPSHHHQQQHSPHHYPLHVQPPFFTIQVQVPPPQMLMPGRRMMIPGSPMTGGYPINVVVPEGVAPGMYIPVSIPNPNSGVGGNTAIPHHG